MASRAKSGISSICCCLNLESKCHYCYYYYFVRIDGGFDSISRWRVLFIFPPEFIYEQIIPLMKSDSVFHSL